MTVIFGDGAGALCLEGVETEENIGVLGVSLHAQGELAMSLMTVALSSRVTPRLTIEMIQEGRHIRLWMAKQYSSSP